MRGAIAIALALITLIGAHCPIGASELPSEDVPVLITADELIFDRDEEVVTARGNVEISQNARALNTDEVIYNIPSRTVTAVGNVTLLEPDGEVIFADRAEIDDRLATGFIEQVRVLLRDQSRLAAASAERTEGRYVTLTDGVFSPCRVCRDHPERAPLWQIKAREVVHDQEEKSIEYRDAWMEFFGVPVFYTPYFQHPDPTVERQSGILAPTVGTSENLGFTAQTPVFWAIDEVSDFTFSPIITTKQSVVLGGEYRRLFQEGGLAVTLSGTIADRKEDDGDVDRDVFRGHIDATGRFNLDPTWRTGFDLQRATDDTYLRLYDFSADRTLRSRAFVEGFRARNYAAVNAFTYQGLRDQDDNDEFPIVAPSLGYSFVGEPDADFGGKPYFDAGLRTLTRIEGRDNVRIGIEGGYEIPYTSPIGDVYSLKAQVLAEGYWTNGVQPGSDDVNPPNGQGDDVTGRVLPQLALEWRYPWLQDNETWQQVVEPIAQVVVAPPTGNPNEIPNEDSLGFEFDDSNIFELNRFPGLDVADSGSRLDYGLNWRGDWGAETSAEAFFGQSLQIIEPNQDIFPKNSGVGENFSDFVGRVQLTPFEEFDLMYRFRFDDKTLKARRNEVEARFGVPAFNVNMGYLFADNQQTSEDFGKREEINVSASSQLTNNWSVLGSLRRDLDGGKTLSWSAGLAYNDECFTIEGVFRRKFFDDREIEPDDSVFVRVVFKHLGGVGN